MLCEPYPVLPAGFYSIESHSCVGLLVRSDIPHTGGRAVDVDIGRSVELLYRRALLDEGLAVRERAVQRDWHGDGLEVCALVEHVVTLGHRVPLGGCLPPECSTVRMVVQVPLWT